MGERAEKVVTLSLPADVAQQLDECAAWRGVSVADLARAYVEDWIVTDYPRFRGRQTRRAIYRDDPQSLSSLVTDKREGGE